MPHWQLCRLSCYVKTSQVSLDRRHPLDMWAPHRSCHAVQMGRSENFPSPRVCISSGLAMWKNATEFWHDNVWITGASFLLDVHTSSLHTGLVRHCSLQTFGTCNSTHWLKDGKQNWKCDTKLPTLKPGYGWAPQFILIYCPPLRTVRSILFQPLLESIPFPQTNSKTSQ